LGAAWNALRALTRPHSILFVSEDAIRHFAEDDRDDAARVRRAAQILANTRAHIPVATFKIDSVAVAGRWIAIALLVFALTGTFVAVMGATREDSGDVSVQCELSKKQAGYKLKCR
jgi:hypothetical protein